MARMQRRVELVISKTFYMVVLCGRYYPKMWAFCSFVVCYLSGSEDTVLL